METIKKFLREEEGMETIQVVMVLAAAAVIISGLAAVWNANKPILQKSVQSFLTFSF